MVADLLVEFELSRPDWSKITEADGPATWIPYCLRELIDAQSPEEVDRAWPYLAVNVADFWRRWHITLQPAFVTVIFPFSCLTPTAPPLMSIRSLKTGIPVLCADRC